MEIGGVAICIDNRMFRYASIGDLKLPLTNGRKYRILGKKSNLDAILICVNNDQGRSDYYRMDRFSTIEDIREDKLNKLMNE